MKKIKAFFIKLWEQLKDRTNIIIFVSVLVVVYSPTWLLGVLGIIFKNTVMLGIAGVYALFWAGPFTPFFPMVIALTFFVRKIVDKIRARKNDKKLNKTL